ncbi:MAG: glycosyltransferase [Lachnospiraceae bacterium]|nr:glycosyltransferase [Lachnospiraceae bacterium]
MKKPLISVLMTIYKDKDYLSEAIESILNQTYKNFEFIIIAEPETPDESLEIIKSFQDKRIRLIINKKHLGFPNSLNKGIRIARGKYIARMDADDISLRNRLLIQLIFMEFHAKIVMCGTNVFMINSNGEIMNKSRFPGNEKAIRVWLYFACVIFHPTVMFRKDVFISERFFYKGQQAEDYELWTRICLKHNIRNLRSALLKRRIHSGNSIYLYRQEVYKNTVDAQKRMWNRLGIVIDISKPFYENGELTPRELRERKKYIDKLEQKVPFFLGKKLIFQNIRNEVIKD